MFLHEILSNDKIFLYLGVEEIFSCLLDKTPWQLISTIIKISNNKTFFFI